MFKNSIKMAWRNLLRNKLFSSINIAGLTIGSTCFLLISLYVYTQYQYDKHHEAGLYLYRVETELNFGDVPWISATVSPPIVPMMLKDFPEVVNATRVVNPPETSHHILKWKNTQFFESKGFYVDSTYFSMFDYHWTEGRREGALQEPYTVVLTLAIKEKLFGRHSALGETININNRFGNDKYKVTGVVDPSKHKSHIRPNFYVSMNSGGIGEYVRGSNEWSGGNFIYGYVALHPSTDPRTLEAKIPAFLNKYGGEQLESMGATKTLSLQRVSDIHLKSSREGQVDTTANAGFLNLLLLIAGFILIIACVNFMNLATAKSVQKGLEVGVRKTLGANQKEIAIQFYVESFFVVGISFALAIGMTWYLLPLVSDFIKEEISIHLLKVPTILFSALGIYVITSLVAGSYPALFLSSFKPITAIKGHVDRLKGVSGMRKSLVVVQFAISLSMIIGSIIILQQMAFIQKKDLGFEVDHKIVIPFRTGTVREKLLAFKNEVLRFPQVNMASGARIYPGQFMPQDFNLYKEGGDMDRSHNVNLIQGDEDYFKTLGIPLLQGRNFSKRDTSLQILINQTGLHQFGISEDEAVGQRLYSEYQNEKWTYEVIGVVKDYNQVSLKQQIQPMIFEYRRTERSLALLIDANMDRDRSLLTSLESKWNELNPSTPFEFYYLDKQIQKQYKQESQLRNAIWTFTLIAIFISCLGLFGLSAFIAEQRSKEISIRKILGATSISIITTLSKDYIKLIVLSLLVAAPISWYAIDIWLQGFAYRIDINWWVFVMAGLIAIAVALFTIGAQSVKAAFANPVDSLKSD